MPRGAVRTDGPSSWSDEPIHHIELPRETGTHGDVLAAVGLADLLQAATRDGPVGIRQREREWDTGFVVSLPRPQRPSELRRLRRSPGYPYLQSKSLVPLPAGVTTDDAVDYQSVRDRINNMRSYESELHEKRNRTHDPIERSRLLEEITGLRETHGVPPQHVWRRYPPYLMLQGHETANKLLTEILALSEDDFRDIVGRGLAALAARLPSGVTWKVNTVQLFSPNAAKGYARLKPDSTGRGDKSKDAWADPFVEWLRYRGYFAASIPVFHGSQGEHIRLLVPIPADITISAYKSIVSKIPTPPRGSSAPKIDILTPLRIATLLIEHSDMAQVADVPEDSQVKLRNRRLAEVISGLAITNYQSLGSARAVSSMSELAVPGWFRLETEDDATAWLAILDEHRAIVRGLQDNHSDELALLLQYRRILEQRGDQESNEPALQALLDFAGAYGSHVLRAREAGRRVRQFSTRLFERVVRGMSTRYADILEDEGFKVIARAVRRATVGAQIMKDRVKRGLAKDHREIRYGLLPELRRTSQLATKGQRASNEPFLAEVAKFVDLYNAENARRQEATSRPWGAYISTEDLLAFTLLVDSEEYGAGIVGALLCAYGTCTERREAPAGEAEPSIASEGGETRDELSEPGDTEAEDED